MSDRFDKMLVDFTVEFIDDHPDIHVMQSYTRQDLEMGRHTAWAERTAIQGYTPSKFDKVLKIRTSGQVYPAHRIARISYEVDINHITEAS